MRICLLDVLFPFIFSDYNSVCIAHPMRSVYPVHLIRRLAAQLCQKEVLQNITWLSSKAFDTSQFLCGHLEMMINVTLRLACPSLYEYRSWISFLQRIFGKRQLTGLCTLWVLQYRHHERAQQFFWRRRLLPP